MKYVFLFFFKLEPNRLHGQSVIYPTTNYNLNSIGRYLKILHSDLLTGFFLFALPVEFTVFHHLHESVFLFEIHRQVRGQDGVLHQLHHAPVVFRRQRLEYVVAIAVQYHHALVEVMMFHRAGRVQNGQRRFGFRLKSVIRAPMVEIVTQTRHEQSQNLRDHTIRLKKKNNKNDIRL